MEIRKEIQTTTWAGLQGRDFKISKQGKTRQGLLEAGQTMCLNTYLNTYLFIADKLKKQNNRQSTREL